MGTEHGAIATVIRAAVARPGFTLIITLAAALLGVVSATELRRDVFPDLAAPVFNVIVQEPSMAAEEMEIAVALPVEAALGGLPEVRRVRSASQSGVSQITVEFEADADYHRSRQLVAERMAQIATQMPPGVEAPLLSSLTGRLNEILEFTLEADAGAVDLMTLRDFAEFEVRNRLLAVPGVAAVERLGGYLRQFQVQIEPARMAARGVTLDQVLHAVDDANVNASGGFVVQGGTEWTVRAIGRVSTIEDLRTTVVAVKGAVPVLLGDIADVREAPAVRRGMAHRLAGEVVSGRVVKQFGADTVAVAEGVRAALDEIRRSLPEGVQLRMVYDQSALVETALGGVARAMLVGAVLVTLVLFALLNWRAALIVTITLPLSLALAGLLLRAAGIGLNTMTLGGLAVAVGLLVDAAIIVTENVAHQLQRRPGAATLAVATDAAIEVGRPILFATLIVMTVFGPLFLVGGIEGRMYRPLAAAVVAALAASLVLALTLVPVASALLLRRNPKTSEDPDDDGWIIRKVKRGYAPLLDGALRHAGFVRIATLAITIPALALAFSVGTDFMPQLNEGALLLQTMLPADTALEEVDRMNHRVEDVLRRFPEVEDVVRRTGRAERTEDPMPHVVSDVLVVLRGEAPGGDAERLAGRMREALAHVPGVSVLFTTPLGMRIDEGLGGTPADISVRIFGPDLQQLSRLASAVQEAMEEVAGIEDLRAEGTTALPQLRVVLDRPRLARAGLTPGDVMRALRVGLVGETASDVWIGQRRYDLVVRLADPARQSAEAIRGLRLEAHDGTLIPIEQIAHVEQVLAPGTIRREAGSRRLAVEANISGRDLGGAASDVRAAVGALPLPTGYFLQVGGRVEDQARATRALLIAVGAAIFGVCVLLYLALGSFAETMVIVGTLPDALVGGVLALLIAGETWNVSSFVGLIALFGIAVQNGLVLVAQTRTFLGEGMPFPTALRMASLGRVRPKLMTAVTAILGLLPLLVLRDQGTEIERPLAVVMTGGLLTSTVFTLLALPTFYLWVHSWRRRADRRP
jgi:cobalt-zinc-cadmium resistance protein CzcA